MLLENSLYTTPAERDALVADKKRVMDALCFSLFGFLGCYQLAQNRSFLKTYQQTEGQLRLSVIGDNNHDVSLALKLAVDAGTVPMAAAQNVTKLLYKIKSKQIRGTLDEKLIRDVTSTLKIGSHRPDTMVYSVVSDFEDGTLGLGQTAAKLYNLSKIKQFQSVSGEFRQLVMKGQYQELFAKLPKAGNTAAVTVTSSAPKHAVLVSPLVNIVPTHTPVVVPAVVPRLTQFVGFEDVDESIVVPFYKEMINHHEWTPAVLRDRCVSFCKKNKITITATLPYIANSVSRSLSAFAIKKFNQKDFLWMGNPIVYPKWAKASDGPITKSIIRCMYVNHYHQTRHLIEEGRWEDFEIAMTGTGYNTGPIDKEIFLDDFTNIFLKAFTNPQHLWSFIDRTGLKFKKIMENCTAHVFNVSGGGQRNPKTSQWPMDPEVWTLVNAVKAEGTWANSTYLQRAFCAGYENADAASLFVKAFDLENSNVSVKSESTGRGLIVGSGKDRFKGAFQRPAEELVKLGYIKLIDITDAFATMTDQVTTWLKGHSNRTSSFWSELTTVAKDAFGNLNILATEKFLEWIADEIESGKIPLTVLNEPPDGSYYAEACPFFWNAFMALADKYPEKVAFSTMVTVNAWAQRNDNNIKDPAWVSELFAIFDDSCRYFDDSDVNSTLVGARFGNLERVTNMMAKAVADGRWKLPVLQQAAWLTLFNYGPKTDEFYNMWNFNNNVANGIYSSYQGSAYRAELIKRLPELRADVMGRWMSRWSPKGPSVEALRQFFRDTTGYAVQEKDIAPEVVSFLMKCIEMIPNHKVLFSSLIPSAQMMPDWLATPIKAQMEAQIKTTTNMVTVANAQQFMDKKSFNDFVTKHSIQDFAANIVVNGTDDAQQLCDILNKIAHHPNDYSVQVLLRFAYAMHKNVKAIRAAGTAQYAAAAYESVCEALNSLSASGKEAEVDQVYDALSFAPDLRTKILDWFRKSAALKNALESVKEDAVHSLVDINQKRMNQLMKFNNIKFPTAARMSKGTKLSDIMKTAVGFDLDPLHVNEDKLDEAGLNRRTAEYDAFNKYRHGNIGVRFLKSFNVAIPSQIAANAIWDAEHPSSERMDPVFHGTGSVAATFVLRYGFAVISATDSSVVGRMLGNGIYFSNVLDKCGQYVSDGGYSRGKGTKGYIFQMRANLGAYETDYKSSNTTVSPEWCVFHPNDQLNIYKAHFVELVDQSVILSIKAAQNLNENFFQVEQFKEHLNEDLQNPSSKGCVSYTFIDGQIPISPDVVVDFEEFDPTAYGSHVTMEPSALGPVVYIAVDDPTVNDVFAVRYTVQFMAQKDDFQRFQDLLANRVVK